MFGNSQITGFQEEDCYFSMESRSYGRIVKSLSKIVVETYNQTLESQTLKAPSASSQCAAYFMTCPQLNPRLKLWEVCVRRKKYYRGLNHYQYFFGVPYYSYCEIYHKTLFQLLRPPD